MLFLRSLRVLILLPSPVPLALHRPSLTPPSRPRLNTLFPTANSSAPQDFVDSCNKKWLDIEQDRNRGADMSNVSVFSPLLCLQ